MVYDKEELKEVIEELSEYKGSGTELISVYVPADQEINTVQRQLETESSTAKNIKSAAIRKNVMESLDKMVRYLKSLDKTPKNGLALFAGDVSQTEGQRDIQLWAIEPPQDLRTRTYRCDKEFLLEPLEEQLEVKEIYGLVVMDRNEATIGVLAGKRTEILHHITSGVPGKTKAGGQSAQRFERITEDLVKDFFKRISHEMKNEFFDNEKLKGILVGGPMPTKDDFLDNGYLPDKLQQKVIGRIDLGGSDESGIRELVQKSGEVLANQEITRERNLLEDFFGRLGKDPSTTLYKEEEVRKALSYGAVQTLLLSKTLDKAKYKELEKLAEDTGATVEGISDDTDEGKQFKDLSGIGAVLRFKVE